MQVFQQAITQCEPKFFHSEASKQIWELSLNVDLSSILQTIKAEQDCSHVFCIYGEPGSGCTTLVQGVCQCLCESNVIKESDILYLSLNQGSSEVLLWDFMSKLANERNDQGKVTLFTQSSVKVNEKRKALSEFLQHHFKVICIDNAADHWVDALIKNVLKTCNMTSFIVYNEVKDGPNNDMSDLISSISVYGLMESSAKALITKLLLSHDPLTDEHKSNLCDLVNCNPFALELLSSVLSSSDSTGSKVLVSTLQKSNFTGFYKKTFENCALDRVLEVILDNVLKVPGSIDLLCQLSSLRRPLPLLNIVPELEELLQLNLLRVKQEGDVKCVDLHPTLKKHLVNHKTTNFKEDASIDIFMCWLSLLSTTLISLIHEAEENAWPFVPEKWQFIRDVGKEENYNVKELITCNNANVPFLTGLQILQECLYHTFLQKDFSKLAALVLVLDRFLYWHGDAKTTMDVVDYIQANSPETAIAPQLLIRRARFMKNEGNLREAEATLDRLLHEEENIGQWKYREHHDFQLVSGVCVQIKGEIQYRLGHWREASTLLIRSIEHFRSLPKPDRKGLSSSYGLLSLCLRNMTVNEYLPLADEFGLLQCHPLRAAYFSAQEASKLSVYTPMFFLRHSCQAGEVMLEFVRLATTTSVLEKEQLLRVAIEDLKDSMQAHQTYKSLTSREEFYLLVCACYKLSLAFLNSPTNSDHFLGLSLKELSLKLYEHYCCSCNHVPINDRVVTLIDKCLVLLGLEKFQKNDLPNAGQLLLTYYNRRRAERLKKNLRLVDVVLFDRLQTKQQIQRKGQLEPHNQSEVSKSCNTENEHKAMGTGVVDRCADTVESQENEEVQPQHKAMGTGVVDRCADTVESQENEEVQPQHKAMGTRVVDRCADTVESQENEEVQPQHKAMGTGVVDRCADTVESQENEEVQPQHKAMGTGVVDRCADALDSRLSIANAEEQRLKTVDECVMLIGHTAVNELPSGVIVQSLKDEAVSLISQSYQMPMVVGGQDHEIQASEGKVERVRDAILWKYDFASSQWRGQATMVFIGDQIKLDKGTEGTQRDIFSVEFINQDEPLGRYVAKRYRKEKRMQQYENDLLSQMTARQYVALFNRSLSRVEAGAVIGEIQFLPVVLLQLVDSSGHVTEVFNAEPYMSGEFIKLTNNVDWKNEKRRTDLVLAFSHFTYQASNAKLIIVDIQGWAPHDNKGCTFLTDPQIHSTVYKCFGTGNFKEEGYENFWRMHSECNEICNMLNLVRPKYK